MSDRMFTCASLISESIHHVTGLGIRRRALQGTSREVIDITICYRTAAKRGDEVSKEITLFIEDDFEIHNFEALKEASSPTSR